MSPLHAFGLLAILTAPMKGCGNEHEIVPLWEPSILDRLGCDESDDAAAAPEDRPVAVCDVSKREVTPIYDEVVFLGVESYDPNGLDIVDWHWELVEAPEGSAVEIGSLGPIQYDFVPDLVGTYTAELIVTNEACVMSEPCRVSFDAIPSEDLWVEMFWEHPGDDMDLHLLRPDGALETDGDCYYMNCVGGGPDWGEAGDYRDNPTLDLDDIPGTGPENINISDPASGTYTVYVHDYPGSAYDPPNDVTVRIYLAGELVWRDTRTITGEDVYRPFAQIDWPRMEVDPLP